MHYKIVVVRDRAADCYGQPVFVQSLGSAVRSFQDEINKEGTPFHSHPDDYDLYHCGEFDDESGLFNTGRPSQIAVGKDLVR